MLLKRPPEQIAARKRLSLLARPLPTHRRAAVTATTGEGTVVYWNQGAERLYGWSAREALGRNCVQLTSTLFSRDDALQIMSILRAGQPWSGDVWLRGRRRMPIRTYVMNFPLGDLAHGRGLIVGVSVPSFQADLVRGDRLRVAAELHRRAYGTHLVRNPLARAAGEPPSPRRNLPRASAPRHSPIGSLRRVSALHEKRPRPADGWSLMQRVETFHLWAEGGHRRGAFLNAGQVRLARMWRSLSNRLQRDATV